LKHSFELIMPSNRRSITYFSFDYNKQVIDYSKNINISTEYSLVAKSV